MNRQDAKSAKETKKHVTLMAEGHVDEFPATSESASWSLASVGFQALLGALGVLAVRKQLLTYT